MDIEWQILVNNDSDLCDESKIVTIVYEAKQTSFSIKYGLMFGWKVKL